MLLGSVCVRGHTSSSCLWTVTYLCLLKWQKTFPFPACAMGKVERDPPVVFTFDFSHVWFNTVDFAITFLGLWDLELKELKSKEGKHINHFFLRDGAGQHTKENCGNSGWASRFKIKTSSFPTAYETRCFCGWNRRSWLSTLKKVAWCYRKTRCKPKPCSDSQPGEWPCRYR